MNCVIKLKKLLWNNLLLMMLLISTILGILLGTLLRDVGPFKEPHLHPREMMYLQFPGEIILNIMKVSIDLKKTIPSHIIADNISSLNIDYILVIASRYRFLPFPTSKSNLSCTANPINTEKYFENTCNYLQVVTFKCKKTSCKLTRLENNFFL